MKHLLVILGTRPEIIKLAPLVRALRETGSYRVTVLATGQHREMAEQAFSAFALKPDIDLALMSPKQTPADFLARELEAIGRKLLVLKPDLVFVQGDTTTALGGALATFHEKIPIAHVEAGLRSHDPLSPFPEEMNRTLVSRMTKLHYCPTIRAVENLAAEGITDGVEFVGNTVVDALLQIDQLLTNKTISLSPDILGFAQPDRRFILVTGHRRENFDGPLELLGRALENVLTRDPTIEVVFPTHLNPQVQTQIQKLAGNFRIRLLPPVDYPTLLFLLKHSLFAISDSGGIQEEAPTFLKRVLVTRFITERFEAIETGFAELCPLDDVERVAQQIEAEIRRPALAPGIKNPFGDGQACSRIVQSVGRYFQ